MKTVALLLVALALAVPGSAAPTAQPPLAIRVAKLERDNTWLRFTLRNVCEWFRHPPATDDPGLNFWFQNVGRSCAATKNLSP